MSNSVSQLAKELGKRGGLATKKKGREYYQRIGKLGLAKRYNKSHPVEETSEFPVSKSLRCMVVQCSYFCHSKYRLHTQVPCAF